MTIFKGLRLCLLLLWIPAFVGMTGQAFGACADISEVSEEGGLVVSFTDARTATASLLAAADGRLVYDEGQKLLKYCDGTRWLTLLTGDATEQTIEFTGNVKAGGEFAGPYMRLGFYRYASGEHSTATWLHLKTNQPRAAQRMQTIEFKGFEYDGGRTIDARVGYYAYAASTEIYAVGTDGTHNLVAYATSDDYVAIAINARQYHIGFVLNQYAANPSNAGGNMFPIEIVDTLWTTSSSPAF